MPEVIKFSKGTVAEHNNFTGENGEITLICDDSPNRKVTGVIRLHDGQTVGGIPFGGSQLLNDLHDVNAANTIANQILTVNANGEFYFANTVETIADGTISGDKIFGGTISDSVLKLKSSGDSIVASDGTTGILSESSGIVMLTADSVNIGGGAIDGTVIGGSTAAAGSFTTLTGTFNGTLGSSSIFQSKSITNTMGSSGYARLPNNLLIQWGVISWGCDAGAGWKTASATFPISFTNVFAITLGAGTSSSSYPYTRIFMHGGSYGLSNSGFSANAYKEDYSGCGLAYYIAIGYIS